MSQNTGIGNIYTKHHAENRRPGFTIMETGRSEFLKKKYWYWKKSFRHWLS
jgi:hypothetical protein